MTKYLVTGRPLGLEVDEIGDQAVGTVFEADFAPDVEERLVGEGVLQRAEYGAEEPQEPADAPAEPAPVEAPAEVDDGAAKPSA